jgi:hypothetical protein
MSFGPAPAKPRSFGSSDPPSPKAPSRADGCAAASGYAGRPVLRRPRKTLANGQSESCACEKSRPRERIDEGAQRGAVRQACEPSDRGGGGASRCRRRQASLGRARSALVERRNAGLQPTAGEKYPVREMVFRLEGQPASRRTFMTIARRKTEIFASRHPISPRHTNHAPEDFQDGRLRHKIVACFACARSLKSAGRPRADWPGDSPCPL